MKVLVIKDIVLNFYGENALHIDDFSADTSFAIIAASGNGKTNFLNVLSGLVQIESGEIYIYGTEVAGKKTSKRGISLLSSQTLLFQKQSAYKNLVYPLKMCKYSKNEKALKIDKVRDIIKNIDLTKKVENLSDSDKTALIFARSIIKEPRLLLIDEPTEFIKDINLFFRFLRDYKGIYILTTYDFDIAKRVAERFVIFKRGKIVFDGDYKSLINSEDKYTKLLCFG